MTKPSDPALGGAAPGAHAGGSPALGPDAIVPTRVSRLFFGAKRHLLRARRGLLDLNGAARRFARDPACDRFPFEAGVCATALWSDGADERWWERGKVQNLKAAAALLDGVVVPAGGLFSFWRHVGPPTVRRGFAKGRMLQQGCLVASTGGGLCQLSNSLYDAALQAGAEIVERHRHSRVVPGSQAAIGRDATVAWNDVDLRFRPIANTRLSVLLDEETLRVRLLQDRPTARGRPGEVQEAPLPAASDCETCGRTQCPLHTGGAP